MLYFSHKNAWSPSPLPPPPSTTKKPTASPGRFSLALGMRRPISKATEKRPGDEAGSFFGGVAATDQLHWLPKHQKLHFPIK